MTDRFKARTLIALSTLLFASTAAAQTTAKQVTVLFKSGDSTGRGFLTASAEVKYAYIDCVGDLMLTYTYVRDSLRTSDVYVYEGRRYTLPSHLRNLRYDTIPFAGTVHDGAKVSMPFSDAYTASISGGCLGQTRKLGNLKELLPGKRTDEREEIYFSNLVLILEPNEPLISNSAEDYISGLLREEERAKREAENKRLQEEKDRRKRAEEEAKAAESRPSSSSGASGTGSSSGAGEDSGWSSQPREQQQPDREELRRRQLAHEREQREREAQHQERLRAERLRRQREQEQAAEKAGAAVGAAIVAAEPLIDSAFTGVGKFIDLVNGLTDRWIDLDLNCRLLTSSKSGENGHGCGMNVRWGGILYLNAGAGYMMSPNFTRHRRSSKNDDGFAFIDATSARTFFLEFGPGVSIPFHRSFHWKIDGGFYLGAVEIPETPALGTFKESGVGTGFFIGTSLSYRLPEIGLAFALNYRLQDIRVQPHLASLDENVAIQPNLLAHSFGLAVLYRFDGEPARKR